MKAAVYYRPHERRSIGEVELLQPQLQEVTVRIAAAGATCTSSTGCCLTRRRPCWATRAPWSSRRWARG